jgi:uncharacterized membrane protein YqjE
METEMGDGRADATATILRRLAANLAAMAQTYALLAGQEARATVRDLTTGLLFLGLAAVLAVLVLAMMVVTAVLALAVVLQPWQAAVVVLDVTALITVVFLLMGLGRLRRRRLQKVVRAFKEDLQWLRTELLGND